MRQRTKSRALRERSDESMATIQIPRERLYTPSVLLLAALVGVSCQDKLAHIRQYASTPVVQALAKILQQEI